MGCSASAACSTWAIRCKTCATSSAGSTPTRCKASMPRCSAPARCSKKSRNSIAAAAAATRCWAPVGSRAPGWRTTMRWRAASPVPQAGWGGGVLGGGGVRGMERGGGGIGALQTSLGPVKAERVGCVAAGHSSVLARMAGLRLPLQSHPLQAFVSESMQPVIDTVIMSNAVHGYLSQSDKGELVIGAGIDGYLGYGQRGSPHVIEHTAAAIIELFPQFSRVRMNRQWGGIVDVAPDACPIISATAVQGLYFNCGWGTGGLRATPGSGHVFADMLAHARPPPLAQAFALERFASGHLIDEHGAAGVAH